MTPRWYLVAYDISDRRRWRRVFKHCSRLGTAVQRSVFLCRLTERQCTLMGAELSARLDPAMDRLAIAELGVAHGKKPETLRILMGASTLEEDSALVV